MKGYFLFILFILICFYNLFLFIKYLCNKSSVKRLNIDYGFRRKYIIYIFNQIFALICLILAVLAIVYL